MKHTFYQLFDFLDFDPGNPGEEQLWTTGRPSAAFQDGRDIVLSMPCRQQKPGRDIVQDPGVPPREIPLRIRSYGNGILRVASGSGKEVFRQSEMLSLHPGLEIETLSIEKKESTWDIRDTAGSLRARVDLSDPVTRQWSDLVPAPEPGFGIEFYPDGQNKIELSTYDRFFPARQEAFPLAFVFGEGIGGRDGNKNKNVDLNRNTGGSGNEKGNRNAEEECRRTSMSFRAEPDEVFSGTGERFAKSDLSGRTIELRNMDGQGVNNRRCYKNVPFYLSSRMYGIFMHTSAFGKISLAGHSTRSVQLMADEDGLDLFLFAGSDPGEILYRYRQVTGFPAVPPLWSFGTWMSRMTYFSAGEVQEVCDRLRKEDYPADVIHLDTGWFRTDWLCEWTFNEARFPDPAGFIARLAEQGFRVSLWQMPYIAERAVQHDEALENKYIGKRGGKEPGGDSNFSALDYAGTIDLTRPEAVEWYRGLLKNLLEMGVACIKTDFGEDIHMDAEYYGMKAEKLRNLYALLYQKTVFELTSEVRGEGIIWARAGWAGCQRYPVHWGGDAACTWEGMAGSLKGGLHIGLSGFGFWSHDVPGFHGLPDFMNSVIPEDLYVRWTQFGVFTSHLRYHGSSGREPWLFPGVAEIVRSWLKLRYALLPYLEEQANKVSVSGFPMLRSLVFHHRDDHMCWHIDDQYYFGDDFLVAPVMNSEGRRDVYLPRGEWIGFFGGEAETGEQWLKNVEVPLGEMPVWVRNGARIPFYPDRISCTDEYDRSKIKYIEFNESYRGLRRSFLGDLLNL